MRLRSTTTLILSLIGLISGCGQSSPDALDAAQPIRPAYVTTVTENSAPKRHIFIGKVDAAQHGSTCPSKWAANSRSLICVRAPR